MDWRENAKEARSYLLDYFHRPLQEMLPPETAQELRALEPGEIAMLAAPWDRVEPKFAEAFHASSHEDMTPLADYLTSDEPLGRNERARLARMLPKPKKTGRPRKEQLQGAAMMAGVLYKLMRLMNKDTGIKDHGHSAEMKEYAARATVEDFFVVDIDGMDEGEIADYVMQVADLMDRPADRRKTEGVKISFRMPEELNPKAAKTPRGV